jgi:hypothetical protein
MVLVRETATCRTCHAEVPLVIWGVHQESHLTAHNAEPDSWLLTIVLVAVFCGAAAIILLR